MTTEVESTSCVHYVWTRSRIVGNLYSTCKETPGDHDEVTRTQRQCQQDQANLAVWTESQISQYSCFETEHKMPGHRFPHCDSMQFLQSVASRIRKNHHSTSRVAVVSKTACTQGGKATIGKKLYLPQKILVLEEERKTVGSRRTSTCFAFRRRHGVEHRCQSGHVNRNFSETS